MNEKKKPEACACRECGRTPVVVKIRRGPWRVACPYLDCLQIDAIGATEIDAILTWNSDNGKEGDQ